MIRAALVVSLALLAGGCSWLPGILQGEDNSLPPASLQALDNPVSLQKRWSRDVGVGQDEYRLNLRPVVQDGRLYVADSRGRVTVLDAASGDEVWSVKTGLPISAGPGVGAGLVLVGTRNAEIVALSATDGAEQWRTFVSSEVLAVPRTDVDKVFVQTADGGVTALTAESGEALWNYSRPAPVLTLRGTGSPAVQHGLVVAGLSSGKLVALTADKGQVVWESSVAIPQGRSELERMVDFDADPVVIGGVVFASTYQGRVAVVELSTGNIGWTREISSHAGLGIDFSQVYVTDENSHVWALSGPTGASVWKQEQLANRRLTTPVPFGAYVAVGDFEGYLHLLARADGRLAGRVEVDRKGISAPPVVLDDVLYVYGNSGKLAAYALE